jgi:replication factor C subunit 3/5
MGDLIGQDETVAVLRQLMGGGRAAGDIPHLLFYGPPGTGKTSTILALAKEMYGKNWRNMVLELNASDDRGINVVRDEIKTFAGTRQLFSTGGIKLVILDEADAMTPPAQAALRRVIEQYTKHTRFCLICNYSSKIIQALQSRCTRFRFQPLPQAAVRARIAKIIENENLQVNEGGLTALVRLGEGDMRKSLNILQSVAMEEGTISADSVYSCTGHPLPREIRHILRSLLDNGFDECVKELEGLRVRRGLALVDILTDLHALLLSLSLSQPQLSFLLRGLADLEDRASRGTQDAIQLQSLVALFTLARGMGGAIVVPAE